MSGSVIALSMAAMLSAIIMSFILDEADEVKQAEAVARAQTLYAAAAMVRTGVENGYSIPTTPTPLSAAPLPAWFRAPADTNFFLVKHAGSDYLVARLDSEGAAGRVYGAAEKLSPGVAFLVKGAQLRRSSVSEGALPTPPGVGPADVIVKIDGRN